MNIDIDQIGYRWKGIYSQFLTYKDNDVVYKDGGAYVIRNGAPEPFALGQQDAILRGHLLTGGVSAGGFGNMVLHSNGAGGVEFRFQDTRNGTLATQLSQTYRNGQGLSSEHTMAAVMADTSVRSWGNMSFGAGGAGAQAIGRTFPTRVAFPPGTPRIVKMVAYWEGMFLLDAGGTLWHAGLNVQGVSGLGGDSPIPRRVNGSGDLGANTKLVDIFVGCDYYNYAQAAAIDDAGRVYIWGSNRYQSNGVPGATAATNPVPRLVPFTETTPIKQVFLSGSYYQATYLVSEAGMLYVAGQEDAAGPGGGASITEHRLFMPWGDDKPVKLVQTSESDRHTVLDPQYYNRVYCVVLENGDLYAWGYGGNEVQGGWGTGHVGSVWWNTSLHPYKILDGVKDVGMIDGAYHRTLALRTDGTVYHSGYDGFNIGGGGGNRTTWAQIGAGYLENGSKLIVQGGTYPTTAALLRTDGKAVIWGAGASGCAGNGLGAESQAPDSFVLLDKPIVDMQVTGRVVTTTNNITYFALTSDGQVYATGAGSYSVNGDDDSENRFAPAQILF